MKASKLVVVGLLAGLVVGSFAMTAEAAKKKKKKKKPPALTAGSTTLFMRHDSDECDDKTKFVLSATDGEDADCGILNTPLNEVTMTVLDTYVGILYNAADSVPFKLDATRKITGTITMRSFNGAGGGMPELDLIVRGTTGGAEKVLGQFSTSYTATPTGANTFNYEIQPDAALNKADFTALSIEVISHGITVGVHGTVEHDTPPSLIKVPTWVKK